MRKLEVDAYHRVAPLIAASGMKGCRAKWCSVLEGRQIGSIFVDDPTHPQTTLVCGRRVGQYYGFGEANGELLRAFVPELLSEHLPEGFCTLFATSEAWRETLDTLFTRRYTRTAFDFRPPAGWPEPGWQQAIPAGFSLRRADAAVIEMMSEEIRGWVGSMWNGIEEFLAQEVGFCMISNGTVVGMCVPTVIGGGEAETQIWTDDAFRGRGLAKLTATAYVEQCVARGLKPGWTCNSDHHVSAALAQKVGFVPVGTIYGYVLERSYQLSQGRWGPAAGEPDDR
jgi:RimJ/RimL family protein N-acetyltransferase